MNRRGFSLVEILVAMTIMLIALIATSQLILLGVMHVNRGLVTLRLKLQLYQNFLNCGRAVFPTLKSGLIQILTIRRQSPSQIAVSVVVGPLQLMTSPWLVKKSYIG